MKVNRKNRKRKLLWTMKNTFVLLAITRPVVLAITRTVTVNTVIYIYECCSQSSYHLYTSITVTSTIYFGSISNEIVAWMKENVHFVEKASIPSNVPQARPIENLRGILAQNVYEERMTGQSTAGVD